MPDPLTILMLLGGVAALAAADLMLLGDLGPTALVLSIFQRRGGFSIGSEALAGSEAVVLEEFAPVGGRPEGVVRLRGERWTARLEPGAPSPPRGARVVVTDMAGLVLVVRPREA